MSRRSPLRLTGLVLMALTAATLAGCGKKNPVSPPEGLESEFTYPRSYPAAPAVPHPTAEEDDTLQTPPPGRLSPFPFDRTSPTTTYGAS